MSAALALVAATRTRWLVAYLVLAAVALGGVAALPFELARGSTQLSAEQTLREFIATAVQLHHAERGFDIATAEVHGSTSRGDWAHGASTVVPFPHNHITIKLRLLSRTTDTEEMFVSLQSPNDTTNFLADLQHQHGRWLISYWGPAMLIPALARGAR